MQAERLSAVDAVIIQILENYLEKELDSFLGFGVFCHGLPRLRFASEAAKAPFHCGDNLPGIRLGKKYRGERLPFRNHAA